MRLGLLSTARINELLVAGERPPRYGREDVIAQARTIAALCDSATTNRPTEAGR